MYELFFEYVVVFAIDRNKISDIGDAIREAVLEAANVTILAQCTLCSLLKQISFTILLSF